jgi:hypothetical protein
METFKIGNNEFKLFYIKEISGYSIRISCKKEGESWKHSSLYGNGKTKEEAKNDLMEKVNKMMERQMRYNLNLFRSIQSF